MGQIDRMYTDGACAGNPGPGGWGTVIYFTDGSVQELGGADPDTTNNRMEMQAAIAALEFVVQTGQNQPILLYTDSEYLKNGITQWIKGWKKKGWKTAGGKAVLNQDLWEQLDHLNTSAIEWRYIKGHSGDEGNERCDTIARSFSHNKTPTLRQSVPLPIASTDPLPLIEPPASPSRETFLETPPETALETALENTMVPSSPTNPPAHPSLQSLIETLRIADEIAQQRYLITTTELATLTSLTLSTIGDRGEDWTWRNWQVSRVRREGNSTLWMLERLD
jgi:ribonuclease HI